MPNVNKFFRANAAAVIVNDGGQVLAFKRPQARGLGWQFPQGGIKGGESPLQAVYREIQEETAIPPDKLELLHEASHWLSYELPEMYRTKKTGRGQTQKWFLFKFVGDDADIRPDQNEFTEWQWIAFEAVLDQVIAFRRPVYSRLQQELGPFDTAPGCQR